MKFVATAEAINASKSRNARANAVFDAIVSHLGENHPTVLEAIADRDHGGGGAEEASLIFEDALYNGHIQLPLELEKGLERVVQDFTQRR